MTDVAVQDVTADESLLTQVPESPEPLTDDESPSEDAQEPVVTQEEENETGEVSAVPDDAGTSSDRQVESESEDVQLAAPSVTDSSQVDAAVDESSSNENDRHQDSNGENTLPIFHTNRKIKGFCEVLVCK